MEFAYPHAHKILGKTDSDITEHLAALSGVFFDNQTGEQVHFTEVHHYGGDRQVGAEEYWEVQGDDGETYFITENGDVKDAEDSIVGQFEVYKTAASIETTLPNEGYHIGTDHAFAQAGITAHVTLPPVGAFPEGTTIEFPGGFRPYMDWVTSYWDDHGGIVPMSDVPVTITADDPQQAEAVIASARRGGRQGATQEAMKCPNCGSHSFRAMHIDDGKAEIKCLNCGHEWTGEVTENEEDRKSSFDKETVEWYEEHGQSPEFGSGFEHEQEAPQCPICGGPGVFMGALGSLDHYRCRNCGAQFNLRGGVDFGGYGPGSGYQPQGNYRSDEMFLETLPIVPRPGEYGYKEADAGAAVGDVATADPSPAPCPNCGGTGSMVGSNEARCHHCGWVYFVEPSHHHEHRHHRHRRHHQGAPYPGTGTVPPMQQVPQQMPTQPSPGLQQGGSDPCPNCGSTDVMGTGTYNQTGVPWVRCKSCGTMYQGKQTQAISALEDGGHVRVPIGLLDDVLGLGGTNQGQGDPGSCPNCGAGTEAAHPLEVQTDVEGTPQVNLCSNCGTLYDARRGTMSDEEAKPDTHIGKTAFVDHKGNPMSPGNWYVMRSLKYKVPDVIQVLNLEDNRIEASIEGDIYGTFPLHILAEDIDKEGYSFEPYIHEVPGLPEPTASHPNERARQIIDQITEILSSGQGTEDEIDALVKQYYAIRDGLEEQMDQVQQPVQQAPGAAFASWHLARKHFSPNEQRELVDENLGARARNFDKLNLDGTHYQLQDTTSEDLDLNFLWL